jgi:hypothetical protein
LDGWQAETTLFGLARQAISLRLTIDLHCLESLALGLHCLRVNLSVKLIEFLDDSQGGPLARWQTILIGHVKHNYYSLKIIHPHPTNT